MTAPYDTCSFFARDSLLRTEVPPRPYHPYGHAVTATPFRLRDDAWFGVVLLVCLVLAASLVLRLRRRFRESFRSVFLPVPGKKNEPLADDPLRFSTRLLSVMLISLTAAMVTFTYTQHDAGFYPFPETPYVVFGAFFVMWLAYFLMKRWLTGFVNWVFFRDEKIFTWRRAYTFLYVAEAMLSLVLSLAVVFLPVQQETVYLLVVCLVALVKFMQLLKTNQIFFAKMYGTLHLFVYFCTLELMPLLVLQHVLPYADGLRAVKLW